MLAVPHSQDRLTANFRRFRHRDLAQNDATERRLSFGMSRAERRIGTPRSVVGDPKNAATRGHRRETPTFAQSA
jgi:hypothetical protein